MLLGHFWWSKLVTGLWKPISAWRAESRHMTDDDVDSGVEANKCMARRKLPLWKPISAWRAESRHMTDDDVDSGDDVDIDQILMVMTLLMILMMILMIINFDGDVDIDGNVDG
jgi:hypothetical protein